MKKTYQRLPESELDIMLVLWNGTPPMTRPEIEKVINTKKNLAPTTILSLLTRLEAKNFVEVTRQGRTCIHRWFLRQIIRHTRAAVSLRNFMEIHLRNL